MDQASLWIRKAFDILFLSHKIRTCLGILLGYGIYVLKELFSPYLLSNYKDIIDISKFTTTNAIVLGVLIMQGKNIVATFNKKPALDEKMDTILQSIEDARKMGMPEWQIRQMYNLFYKKLVDTIELNDKTQEELNELEQK